MKTILLPTFALAALTCASSASAQLTETPLNSGEFYDLVSAMTDGKSNLLGPHVGFQEYDRVVWDRGSEMFFTNRDGADPTAGLTNYIDFTQTFNFGQVTLPNDFNLGYFGNESVDLNSFGFRSGGTDYTLSTYEKQGELVTPPVASNYTSSADSVLATFFHVNEGNRATTLSAENFSIFYAIDDRPGGSEYLLFTVDDRGDQLIDYDDGFFLLSVEAGSGLIIPEPSTIGLLAVAALLALPLARRFRQRSKK